MTDKLKIQFSDWCHIDDISGYSGSGERGVYVLAHSPVPLSGVSDPYSQSVIYVGETHGDEQSYKKRLGTFVKAAKVGGGEFKHSGGNTFFTQKHLKLENVYVAFCPCEEGQINLIDTIKILKRGLITGYSKKFGKNPECNK